MKLWVNCFAVSGHRDALVNAGGCILKSLLSTVSQAIAICGFYIFNLYNLVHVSLYIILFFSVNEVVEMEIEELPLHVPVASIGLERAPENQAYCGYRGK